MEEWLKSMFELPIKARISIVRIQEREVHSNRTLIYIHDVSTDGLKFMSDLKFPVLDHVILKFEFTFFKQDFSLYGHVVERNDLDNSFFEYDVQIDVEQPEQESFIQLMKQMAHRFPYLEIYRKNKMYH